jgi:hypothetical protein
LTGIRPKAEFQLKRKCPGPSRPVLLGERARARHCHSGGRNGLRVSPSHLWQPDSATSRSVGTSLSDIPDVWSPGRRWPGFSIQPVINRILTLSSLGATFWPASVRTKRPCSLLTNSAPCKRSSVCVAPDLFGRPELVSSGGRQYRRSIGAL